MVTLRDYQVRAADAIEGAWSEGLNKPAVVLPTGAGKSLVMSEVIRRALPRLRENGQRILMLAHREKLLRQNEKAVKTLSPDAWTAVVKGNSGWRDAQFADVILGSLQTMARPGRRESLDRVGLVIADECFPAGTRVGGKTIESLQAGDIVPSWNEETGREEDRPVVAVTSKIPSALMRVTLVDGTSFVATPNHPILTDQGWCPVGLLNNHMRVVSFTHDTATNSNRTLHMVRNRVHVDDEPARELPQVRSGVLFPGMFDGLSPRGGQSCEDASCGNTVHVVRGGRDSDGEGTNPVPGKGRDVLFPRVFGEEQEREAFCDLSCYSAPGRGPAPEAHDGTQPHVGPGSTGEDGRNSSPDRPQTTRAGRERASRTGTSAHSCGSTGVENGHHVGSQGWHSPVSLQAGYGSPDASYLRRSGRGVPYLSGAPSVRPAQGRTACFTGVDHVEVLEPGSDGTYGGLCPDGRVYNLEVDRTHTYLIGNGVVVHNCHVLAARTYKEALNHWVGRGARAAGFTATLTRMDGGLPEVWDASVYEKPIYELIRDGFLVPPVAKSVAVPGLNLSNVRVTAGDLNAKDVADAMDEAGAIPYIARAYLEHASDRTGVVFMPNVATAIQAAAEFNALGIKAEVIHGGMSTREREAVYARYGDRTTQVIVNCNVLVEGFDEPHTGAVVLGRPTKSPGAYIQMVGRGLRLHPDKEDCLILDMAGASLKHNLAGVNDLIAECTARCDCNCLVCGCSDRCKCGIRQCGCRCLEQHESAGKGCKCAGTDQCGCGCPGDQDGTGLDGCGCDARPDCECRGGGAEREGKEVSAETFRNLTPVEILGSELKKSSYAWLVTTAGVRFLPVGSDRFLFLMPESAGSDRFFVGSVQGSGTGAVFTRVDTGAVSASDARQAAEDVASGSEFTYNVKRASWRYTPASEGQLQVLRRLRVEIPENPKKGWVSDAITVAKASRVIDPKLRSWGRIV